MAGNHLAMEQPCYDRALDILGTSIEEQGPKNLFFNTETSNSEQLQNRTEGYGTVQSKTTIVLDSNLGDEEPEILASDDEATCYLVTETLSKQSCNVLSDRHRIRLT